MSVDDRIDDLLVEWEMARMEGHAPSVAELCKEHPEFVNEVEQRIAVLQDLSWTLDPFEVVDNSEEKPDEPLQNLETVTTDVTISEFVDTLSDSGILNDSQLGRLQKSVPIDDRSVQSFAKDLIEQDLITPYQAKVILDRGDSPLLLDRYIILDSIGAGGMGIVFKALQRSLERVVAVKILPKHAVDSPEKVERFQREIRTAAKLSHPNIVQAFDAHESNGVYFLAMEYVDGCDLAALVEEFGPLPVPEAVDIICQAAAGLGSAHDLRIVHRDVKPANILLGEDGVAKILDLGLARTRELAQSTSTNDLTRDGLAMGTVNFMSPEQAFDAKEADERSDIYSLGCTLYYLLHGTPPFERGNSVQTVIAHREEPAPKLSEGLDGVTSEIESVFQRMIAKLPKDRPATMAQVRELLMEAERRKPSGESPTDSTIPLDSQPPTQPIKQSSTPPQPGSASPPDGLRRSASKSRTRWLWPVVAMLLLAIAAFFAMKAFGGNNTRQLAEKILTDDSVTLTLSNDEFEELEVGYASELPEGKFEITGATLFLDDGDNLNSISDLKQIESVSVISAMESGAITVDLRGLENHREITDLFLDQCELDEYAIAQIVRCKNLTTLTISHCRIKDSDGLRKLAELPALRDLILEGTSLSDSDPSWIEKCETIELLDISNTSASGAILATLSKLPRLEALHMTGLDMVEAKLLGQIDQLTSLSLDATNFGDQHVPFLLKLENLSFLDVSHSKLSSQGVRAMCELPSLAYLTVRGLEIDSVISNIAAVPTLTDLDARHTDLTDEGLRKLESAKGLLSLDVEGTNVTEAAFDRFLTVLPACSIVLENDSIE